MYTPTETKISDAYNDFKSEFKKDFELIYMLVGPFASMESIEDLIKKAFIAGVNSPRIERLREVEK